MENPESRGSGGELRLSDLLSPLKSYRNLLLRGTAIATVLTAIVGAAYLWAWQPVRWVASIGFHPLFPTAAKGKYPNELPFASTDIADPAIIDQVFEKNKIQEFCGRGDFASGFFVQESSTELQFLDLEYQTRLADARITQAERERIQNDYVAKRDAVPVAYSLVWIRPTSCKNVPTVVAMKALPEILATWASTTDQKRGVMNLRVAVFGPEILDIDGVEESSQMIRADLVRIAINRVISNIREVEKLPGAEQIHLPDNSSFAQVLGRLDDLSTVHLERLVGTAGRGLGPESARWVAELLAKVTVQQRVAADKAEAYRLALQQYSGVTSSSREPDPTLDRRRPTDVQTLSPQIDRTFIEGIVQLSAANTMFRQELTKEMVKQQLNAVEASAEVDHYKRLQQAISEGGGPATVDAVTKRLDTIIAEAKRQITVFGQLYAEFSNVGLRPGPEMYRVDRPADVVVARSFTTSQLAMLVLSVLIFAPLLLAIGCLIHYRVRQVGAGSGLRA